MTKPEYPLISEADFQDRVVAYADLRGLLVFHDTDSRRNRAGFPDLVMAGPAGVAFLELKREDGTVSRAQRHWIETLRASGAIANVARPSHWDEVAALIDALAMVPRGAE